MKFVFFLLLKFFSQLSALAIVTIPAEVYSYGWQHMVFCVALVFVILVTNYVSLPVFYCNNIENVYVVCITKRKMSTFNELWIIRIFLTVFGNAIWKSHTKASDGIIYIYKLILLAAYYVYPRACICRR